MTGLEISYIIVSAALLIVYLLYIRVSRKLAESLRREENQLKIIEANEIILQAILKEQK